MPRSQKRQKTNCMKCSKKYKAIISKGDNDIGQADLIQMHIATKLNAAAIVAQPYPLALRHHEFLKWEIKKYMKEHSMGKPHSGS